MDVDGIWRYFGNYSFFGAPFIWTTLHNMGGNDGLKGDMRKVSVMPSAALAAKSSVVGVGATPEGIDQNPPYYEYTFDQAWHAEGQDLSVFWKAYGARRYASLAQTSKDVTAAWEALGTAVYTSQAGGWHDNSGVQWKVPGVDGRGSIDASGSSSGINVTAVHGAWAQLVAAGVAGAVDAALATFNYDVVDLGREVLAQIISLLAANLTSAVGRGERAAAEGVAKTLLEAYDDLDDLVACDQGFLVGRWIEKAKKWANESDAREEYYEWQARSQVSTWTPIAPEKAAAYITGQYYGLDGYANKVGDPSWFCVLLTYTTTHPWLYSAGVRSLVPFRSSLLLISLLFHFVVFSILLRTQTSTGTGSCGTSTVRASSATHSALRSICRRRRPRPRPTASIWQRRSEHTSRATRPPSPGARACTPHQRGHTTHRLSQRLKCGAARTRTAGA